MEAQQQGQAEQAAGPFEAVSEAEAPQIDHSELTESVATIQNKLDEIVEKIKQDRRLDKNEQRARIQETWHRAAGAHAELMKVYEARLEERSAQAEHSLFYVIPDNRDSVRSAYNDLYDRTTPGFLSGDPEGIEYAREEMERLWERALRTGDRALETAIGQLAIERGDERMREAYLSRSKEKSQAWERYVGARQKLEHFRNPQERFWGNLTGSWGLRKPPEAG